ncbi:MAG: flagellar assembly peptidoglycan hydrolase FlgJ [Gammaproteobacteria bacterium]|nr:flagellar assembly peptidoglycan hydrolase FlgJ [Gammaproteobacteria bacterium]MDH5800531.1 flagellar assembly peptidoglycan hydrolase FlgJ [Gammaproteobacteria bacterium]
MSIKLDQAGVYTDFKGFADLKRQADTDSNEALHAVARQFEALFLQQIFKSMREAQLGEGLFDSDEGDFYKDLLDKQLSINLAQTNSLGLAEMITRQLQQNGLVPSNRVPESNVEKDPLNLTGEFPTNPNSSSVNSEAATVTTPESDTTAIETRFQERSERQENNSHRFENPTAFVTRLWPMAQRAAKSLGITPDTLMAQAALETGWGKHILRHANGTGSYNLFNIKAGSDWDGDTVNLHALEYTEAGLQQQHSRFKSYHSYDESFDDYVRLLQSNPRYKHVGQSASAQEFTNNLQSAGYATDPQYAHKIMKIKDSSSMQQALEEMQQAIKLSKGSTISKLDAVD